MNKKQILVVSNTESMNDNLFNWINTSEAFDMTFAETHEKAIELSHQQLFDMVLIDSTDEEIHDKKLSAVLPILNAEVLLVQYTGEQVQILDDKVNQAFDRKKRQRLQRLLILDSSQNKNWNSLPPFSRN